MPLRNVLRIYASRSLVCTVVCSGFLLPSFARADEELARQLLNEKGYRVSSSGIVTQQESDLRTALREVTKHRKDLLTATRDLAQVQAAADQIRAQLAHLQKQQVQFSTQLAQVNANDPSNVSLNNKLVGALNAIQGQSNLLVGQQKNVDTELAKRRGAWSDAREDYLQLVLDMRSTADEIQELYEKQEQDEDLSQAVTELNEATGKSYDLAPSRGYLSSIKRLEALEEEVLSESVELRRERNTLYANVVVNGKYKKEMVVDSGASLICLPASDAKDLGVVPPDDAPTIRLVMADGREIEGRLVVLDEVRVGKFTVEKVEAAVLGPDATSATPLLGMSFLGNFKFELDAKAATLDLVDIEGANPAAEKDTKPASRRRR